MAIQIRELQPDGIEDAVSLARSCGSQLEAPRIISCLSLIAHDGEQVLGALLCQADTADGYRLELSVTPEVDGPDLGRTLVDKALLKLHARGVHKCHITTPSETADQNFWTTASWIREDLPSRQVQTTEPSPTEHSEPSDREEGADEAA